MCGPMWLGVGEIMVEDRGVGDHGSILVRDGLAGHAEWPSRKH